MRVAAVFIVLACLLLMTAPSAHAVSASVGFINENAQLLVLGELVDVGDLENDDFSATDIQDFYYIELAANPNDNMNMQLILHIEFSRLGEVVYELWTERYSELTLGNWVQNQVNQPKRYTNSQLYELGWIYEDEAMSTPFNAETLTGVIDGGNLAGGIYLIKVEVYGVVPPDLNPTLEALSVAPIQVASPSRPVPITPLDNEEAPGYPIFFSWSGVGAEVMPQDVSLVIVEADQDNFDDPQTVIDNRNIANTRYEGMPQFSDYHVYTGANGSEQALTDGRTYVWMVTVSLESAGFGMYDFSSTPTTFIFNESGIDDFADEQLEEEEGGPAEDGFINNPPRERDSEEPIPDPIFALLLQNGMTQSQIDELIRAFEGFYVEDIKFDDRNGHTYPGLARKLNTPGLEVITVTHDGEE